MPSLFAISITKKIPYQSSYGCSREPETRRPDCRNLSLGRPRRVISGDVEPGVVDEVAYADACGVAMDLGNTPAP